MGALNLPTGTYARGAAAYGPYGARGVAQAYNPRTGTYAQTRQGSNVYGSWGSTAVQRGDDWARTNRYTNRQTGTTTRTIRTDEGGAVTRSGAGGGRVAARGSGNGTRATTAMPTAARMYVAEGRQRQLVEYGAAADHYATKTEGAGSGQRPTTTERSGTTDQLNRDSAARREGNQRTSDYGSYRSGSGSRGGGSYRGGGGGGRGGGGRRR